MDGNSSLREGKILFASGRPEAGIHCFTLALEQGIDPVVIGLCRGAANMALRRYAEAEEDFSLTLAQDPDNERAWYYRGVARVAAGKYAAAIEDLSRSLAANQHRGIAYLARGLAYTELGEHDKAGPDFKAAATYSNAEAESFLNIFKDHSVQLNQTMTMLKKESAPWKALLTKDDADRLQHMLGDNSA